MNGTTPTMGLRLKQNKGKQVLREEILPRQSPRRVILEYILLKLDYNFSSLYYSVSSIFQMKTPSPEDLSHYIVSFH